MILHVNNLSILIIQVCMLSGYVAWKGSKVRVLAYLTVVFSSRITDLDNSYSAETGLGLSLALPGIYWPRSAEIGLLGDDNLMSMDELIQDKM